MNEEKLENTEKLGVTEERGDVSEPVEEESSGSIRIANEVVAIVAGLAATEIEGVAGMSGGLAGGISEMLGRKNLSKGVRVEVDGEEVAIELFLVVDYGVKIPDVAWKTQENVKSAVQSMTGLNVTGIDLHVQGIKFPEEMEKIEGETAGELENQT